jgi:origin recognition complex subunit 5
VVELQSLLEGRGKFILAFDGIDGQREAATTLLPAIARLGEIVRLLLFYAKTRR